MKELDLENYIILTVKNGQLQVLYDEQTTDLYLCKSKNYYLTRHKVYVTSENILLIRQGSTTDITDKTFLKALPLDSYIIFKQINPDLYELCNNKHECNIVRMLLNIFEIHFS